MSIGNTISGLTLAWIEYVKHTNIAMNSVNDVHVRAEAFKEVAKLNDIRNTLCNEIDKEFGDVLKCR